MKKSAKILLALMALPCVAFANPQVNIGVCKTFDNLSSNDIKFIEEGYFLDSEGYRVEPCKHGDKIFFPILGKVENGDKIYKESSARAMKQNKTEVPVQSAEVYNDTEPKEYSMTYGDGNYEVQDVSDFRASVRREEMKAVTAAPNKEYQIPVSDIEREVNMPTNIQLPSDLVNLIRAEKSERLEKDYQEIATEINRIYQPTMQNRMNAAVEILVQNNRVFMSEGTPAIINQYGTQPYEINGAAYAVFDAKANACDFLRGYMDYVTNIATAGDAALDDRLAYIEFLHEQSPETLAGRYAAKASIEVEKMYGNPKALNAEGIRRYQLADENRRAMFVEILSRANEIIMQREYDSLPENLTKSQYHALSNIDKQKYAPVTSGNFVDHSKYQKRPREKLINVAAYKLDE